MYQLSHNQLLTKISTRRVRWSRLRLVQRCWMGVPVGQVPPCPGEVRTRVRVQNEGWKGLLCEVEAVDHIVGFLVPFGQRCQEETLLDKRQKRRKLVLGVADLSLAGVGRNDQQRDAGTQPKFIDCWRGHMVIETTEIIPSYKDCGRRPTWALHDP